MAAAKAAKHGVLGGPAIAITFLLAVTDLGHLLQYSMHQMNDIFTWFLSMQ
jgi:hypothetical protein